MNAAVLVVAAYVITFTESVVQMRALQAFNSKRRFATSAWDAIYDVILLVDVWLIVQEWWLVFPIVVASFHGSWYAFPSRQEKKADFPQ